MTLPAEALDVSVLVPAKDEAPNLPEFVRQCDEALRPAGFSFEVIVVDDGSRDDSARVLRELTRQYPFLRVVTHRRQRGIGAVKSYDQLPECPAVGCVPSVPPALVMVAVTNLSVRISPTRLVRAASL